jgi:predicted nucleic acid-binding protein
LTRVAFDANVIIAASASNTGEAYAITRLARQREDITLLATEYAWDEAERILQRHKPEALSNLCDLRNVIGVVAEPSEVLLEQVALLLPQDKRLPNKDLPILAGAIFAAADYLITHDGEHFGPLYGETIYGVEIQRPATVLAGLYGATSGDS